MNHRNLERIRSELSKQRAALAERCGRVDRDLARRDAPLAADFSEQAVQTQNDQPLEGIRSCTLEEMQAVDEALRRIDVGAYGVCKECGCEIPPARLQAIPCAVTCVTCESKRSAGPGSP